MIRATPNIAVVLQYYGFMYSYLLLRLRLTIIAVTYYIYGRIP